MDQSGVYSSFVTIFNNSWDFDISPWDCFDINILFVCVLGFVLYCVCCVVFFVVFRCSVFGVVFVFFRLFVFLTAPFYNFGPPKCQI